MIYELRVYEILPGPHARHAGAAGAGVGSVPATRLRHSRGVDGDRGRQPRLIYINVYDSVEDRERQWDAFAQDPAWAAIEAESEQDGPIVAGVTSTFMDPASFSPLK